MNTTDNSNSRRPILRRGLTAAALVAGGIVIGAGGLAIAAGGEMGPGMMGPMGWHHHHRGVGMLQRRVRGALDNVGATTAQEDKVHDIIAKASTDLDKDGEQHGAMKKQVLELMKAPTLDKAAFDKLRADKIAAMDAKSKVIEDALFDAASQLSPEQRGKLVAAMEERMEHHGWGGWRHRMEGEDGGRMHDHGGMDHGMGDHGTDGPHEGGGTPDHG